MEEAQILQKKKNVSHDFSSCLLSPESPVDHQFGLLTPSFASPLGCSLTPPSSSDKVVHSRTRLDSLRILTKLNFDPDYGDRELSKQKSSQRSPFHPEDRIAGRRSRQQHLDIISDLLALGCTLICEKICSYMKAQDLYRFGCVSFRWRRFLHENHHEGMRWRGYVKHCKEIFIEREKENRGTRHFQKSSSFDGVTRFPLSGINLKLPERQGQDQQNKASETPKLQICSSHSITPQIKNELRPCPKCTSPSSVSNSHNGHFQCQKCGFRFCPTCLRGTEQHVKSKKCFGLSTAPVQRLGPQKSGQDVIGHKKTKYRLRRLR